jgi:uncharacterized membrane protein HdeD (DUF308 family)
VYQALVRNTRYLALRGVAAVAFGIIAIVWPNLTLVALLALFGVFVFLEGGLTLGEGLNMLAERQTSWIPYILGGVAGIAIGAITFLRPGITALALVYLIAAWAIITGVFEFIAAIELADELKGEWMLGLAGVLSVAFGVLVALDPRDGAFSVIYIIGFYAILAGVTRLTLAYRMRSGEKSVQRTFQQATGQS